MTNLNVSSGNNHETENDCLYNVQWRDGTITLNFTITGRQIKRRQNSKKKNKQTKKSEIRKFNILKTTSGTNRKIIIVRVC